jgi:hypothetical protein
VTEFQLFGGALIIGSVLGVDSAMPSERSKSVERLKSE